MKVLSFDIETGPAPNVKALIRKLYPFDPDKVALGNATKKETIDKKIEDARRNHVPNLVEKAALNPILGQVVAFGWFDGSEYHRYYLRTPATIGTDLTTVDSERDLLKEWREMERMVSLSTWRAMGWNSGGFNNRDGFDIDFLQKRLILNNMRASEMLYDQRGNMLAKYIDLMKVWSPGYAKYAKLEFVAKVLNCQYPDRPKGAEGKDFHKMLNHKLRVHKANLYFTGDLYETYVIGQNIAHHLIKG